MLITCEREKEWCGGVFFSLSLASSGLPLDGLERDELLREFLATVFLSSKHFCVLVASLSKRIALNPKSGGTLTHTLTSLGIGVYSALR